MSNSVPDWPRLCADHPELLVAELEKQYVHGSISCTAAELASDASTHEAPFSEDEALELLENTGSWLQSQPESLPPDPDFPDEEPETVQRFVWRGKPRRQLGWLLLVHGMNTKGLWQEYLAFDVGLWQGKGVPTFIHKYGWILFGVVLPWRRRKFMNDLLERLVELGKQAEAQNLPSKPDVVAHSFGTWLLGHILLDQLSQSPGDRVKVGRVILTGSILRPDFPWARLQQEGIVEDVLNHYGTEDPVVPWAHWTIWDSGPSGRSGFDAPCASTEAGSYGLINAAAPEFGHSTVLSDEERYKSYSKTWKPFLTNPAGSASRGLKQEDPDAPWRQAWLPLRGTLLPLVALLLLASLLILGLFALGPEIASAGQWAGGIVCLIARFLGYALAGLVGLFVLQKVWRFIRS